jgi:hypothetical protein
MTVYHNLYTLSNTDPVRIGPNPRHAGADMTVQNVSASAIIYMGAGNVSVSNYGYRLFPGDGFSVELSPHDTIFAISNVNGTQAAVLTFDLEP